MFAGFRKDDKLPVAELAVPVAVPEQMASIGILKGATPKEQAMGDFGLIAFYYLLRVGEYTQKNKRAKTRTIHFRFSDVAFKKGDTLIPRDESLKTLLEATGATLRLSNQKNGIRGTMIHCSAMLGEFCPVKALVRRFVHLHDNNAKQTDLISSFWDHIGKGSLTDVDVCVAIRRAFILLDLQKNGITSARVGTPPL